MYHQTLFKYVKTNLYQDLKFSYHTKELILKNILNKTSLHWQKRNNFKIYKCMYFCPHILNKSVNCPNNLLIYLIYSS